MRTTLDVVGAMSTLAKTTSLSSSTSKSSALPVFVHRVDDPVDTRIIADLSVGRINKDDFVVFHGGVLVDPVRVENTEVAIFASNLFLSHRLKIALELEVVDTLMLGLTEDHTTVVRPLTSSTADTATDDDISLLGFVTKTVGLVGTRRAVDFGDFRALTVLPSTDTEEETKGVTLLVTPQLFHIFVATHLDIKINPL